MRIRWTPAAERDRSAIFDYIAARDPAAAVRMDDLFGGAVGTLADFPMIGQIGDVAGTRHLTPHRSYRLIYEIVGETVWILTVVHTARRWPPLSS